MENSTFGKFVKELSVVDRFLLIMTVIGVVILAIGLFRGIVGGGQVQMEYLENGTANSEDKIVVDVGGAVEKPGVYELFSQSRVKDVLVAAGGLSSEADRTYVEKNINLAEILKDGEKIYFPKINESQAVLGYSEANTEVKKININLATESELDTLQGIGSARAKEIVKNRPYKNVDELVQKGVLSKAVLEKIRSSLVAY
ncbi:MAG TPA: ComEA family DNA-binding protein [Patescibacteria group bacterium]